MPEKKVRKAKKQPGKKLASKGLPRPLPVSKSYRVCETKSFKFKTTNELKPTHEIIAQSRAKKAINMGLGIRRPGYNIYVAGVHGTGKTSVIREQLEKWAKTLEPPNDWVYLYNFQNPESPLAVSLAQGDGKTLKKSMETLIKSLRSQIPMALQSEDYENAVNTYLSSMNDQKSKLFSDLEKFAKTLDFAVKSSRMGIETIPVRDGRTLSEKDYNKLGEDTRKKIEEQRGILEPEVLDFARKVRSIESTTRTQVESLREEIGRQIISGLLEPVASDFSDRKELLEYFRQMETYIVDNLLDFVEDEESEEDVPQAVSDKTRFNKYKVNLFIDNSGSKGAPIIIENNPTYYNLFGKIEKNVEHGMYLTDFTMIKNGSIHRANGGYLVINIMDIFRNDSTWDTLKRILRNRMGFIEDMGEQYSLLPTSGLRPDPIPLDLKVILIGTDEIYHILFSEDQEFQKIFKIKADFDWKMDRSAKNIKSYVAFIATRAKIEGLLPFDRSGVAAIIEYSSRLVEDQNLLSTQFGEIKDLTIEADYFAREEGSNSVKRVHVEKAIDEKYLRLNLQEENLLKLVESKDILLSVDGTAIGQINGLAVYDYGDHSFGKIGRITCTTSISDSGIVNIERQSQLSGKIHDKGIMILSGFLHSILAKKRRMGLSASVCFEQSYGIIDGDSASAAELIAILSAMSEIPVFQNMAITGSVNQMGEIQSIGGVNEKIEGFYKVCMAIGRGDKYGVVIPAQNVDNLMLHGMARHAVKSGQLAIYPVKHIFEAFEIMTGVPLGLKHVESFASFKEGTALFKIEEKLEEIYLEEMESEHGKESESEEKDHKKKTKKAPPKGKKAARSCRIH